MLLPTIPQDDWRWATTPINSGTNEICVKQGEKGALAGFGTSKSTSGHGQARLELVGALYWFHRIKMQCHFQRGPATWPSGGPRASPFLSNSGERLCKLMPVHAVRKMLPLWLVVSVADQILWVGDCKFGCEPYPSKLPTRFFQGKCAHAHSYLKTNGDSMHTGTSKRGPERRTRM